MPLDRVHLWFMKRTVGGPQTPATINSLIGDLISLLNPTTAAPLRVTRLKTGVLVFWLLFPHWRGRHVVPEYEDQRYSKLTSSIGIPIKISV